MTKTGAYSSKNRSNQSEPERSTLFLFIVYLIVFSAFFDTHAQMPILAPYALSLGAGPFILGVVVGAYSLLNIAGNFAGGLAIDRKNWKIPLFSGLTGVAVILLLYTLASSAYHLILVRSAHGFLGGILVPAALASLIGREQSSIFQRQRLALFGAAIGLAAVTGPLAAGLIANRYGFHQVYYALAALLFLSALIALTLLSGYPAATADSSYPAISIRRLSVNPQLRGAFIFALGTMGATGTLAAFLPVRSNFLGFNHVQTGMLFATFALTAIFIQMIWPRFLRNLLQGDCRGCMLGQLLLALALVLAASLSSFGSLLTTMALFGTGFGLSFQGMLGLVVDGSQPAWRGRAIGTYFAFYSFGAAVVPPLSGLLWQHIHPIFPFYPAAAIALIIMLSGKRVVNETWATFLQI